VPASADAVVSGRPLSVGICPRLAKELDGMKTRLAPMIVLTVTLATAFASAQERRPNPPAGQGTPGAGTPAAAPAPAQTPRPATAPAATAPAFPSQTSATYADWVHRCVRSGADMAQQNCEILQQVQSNQGGQIVSTLTLAVGRPTPQAPLQITALLPVNVNFSAPPSLTVEGGASTEMRWVACAGTSCIVSTVASDALIAKLRDAATKNPRIEFRNAGDVPVAVPFSLNGFGAALDALQARR
jgi:invasion protein IalB